MLFVGVCFCGKFYNAFCNGYSGWVLETEDNNFVDEAANYPDVMGKARIFATRKSARENSYKCASDVVRKVELNEKGKAIKIIPGR